jgi:catechol 2,3-dioxygenase-like lactoylglutathione lyase family enzyme
MSLLRSAMIVTTVAVSDLEASAAFFRDRLGLEVLETGPFAIRFACGGGQISVRRGQPNVGQTVGHFEVEDLDAVMADLASRGITFEDYETPKTVNGVAQIGPARGAWFKDLDGNVFGLREGPIPGREPSR